MSSKETILARIRERKPGPRPLPHLPPDPATTDLAELEAAFRSVLEASKTTFSDRQGVMNMVAERGGKTILSTVEGLDGTLRLDGVEDPLQLAAVDLTILRAEIAVAENGAMWIDERECVHRVLPFITQHLVLFVARSVLVGTMHEAYRKIQVDGTGFGVFVAGPSKTADIEQSLVIGAHGPRSLTVCLD